MITPRGTAAFPLLAAGCLLLLAAPSPADQVTRIIGFDTISCPGGSDTVTSTPYHRPPVVEHAVIEEGPIALRSSPYWSLRISGNPNFEAGAFTTTPHYVRLTSGEENGSRSRIVGHTDSQILVSGFFDARRSLAGVTFDIIPYWTLDTLFPVESQSTFHVSPGVLLPERRSQLLFFDQVTAGTRLAPDRIYFPTPEGWKRADRGFPDAGDTILPPHTPFVIRHPPGAADTTFLPMQVVDSGPSATGLLERFGLSQDTAVALVRPLAVPLKHLDLGTAFADSASTDPGDRADELFLFETLAGAADNDPSLVYFRVGGTWHRDDGSSYPVADDEEIPAASGLLIRKAPGSKFGGRSHRWLNLPRY